MLKNFSSLILKGQASLTNPIVGNWGSNAEDATNGSLFFSFALRMWRVGIYAGSLIVLVYFVWAGVEWITSGNDTKGVESAKKRLTNAAIGLVLMVCSFAIIAYLNELLFEGEFDLLEFTIPG